MPKVKSMAKIGEKWKAKSQSAGQDYADGVQNPRRSWAEATADAAPAYTQGVQEAITRNAFAKGVTKAGDAKWQKNAVEKGPIRFAQGVALAQGSYEAGFAPYRTVIENTTLPARGPKGDPKNIERVRILADNLHKAKLAGQGA